MWSRVCIAHLWIRFCFIFPLKARRGLQIQNCSRQNSAQANTVQSHFWIFGKFNCRLRAVLACVDCGVQTPCSANQFWIFEKYSKFSKYHHVEMKINKFLRNTILAFLSGVQMASIPKIKKWQKIFKSSFTSMNQSLQIM